MKDRGIRLDGLDKKAEELSNQGKTPMFMAIDQNAAGIIAVADTLKENSKEAMEVLHKTSEERPRPSPGRSASTGFLRRFRPPELAAA